MPSVIEELAKIADDDNEVKKIGSELVRDAIQEAARERINARSAKADIVRHIRAGEKAPSDLVGSPGLRLDVNGVASTGWEKTWTNFGLWDRNWSQNETDRGIPDRGLADRSTLVRIRATLTGPELQALTKLKLINP